jgi:hypothetical protein
MAIPSSAATKSGIITMSTVGDALEYSLPVEIIRWHLTTAATTTWALGMTQTTALAGSTVRWPLIGTTTQTVGIEGSTATAGPRSAFIDFWIHQWVFGINLDTISGGFVSIIKGPQSEEWVRLKPPAY